MVRASENRQSATASARYGADLSRLQDFQQTDQNRQHFVLEC